MAWPGMVGITPFIIDLRATVGELGWQTSLKGNERMRCNGTCFVLVYGS